MKRIFLFLLIIILISKTVVLTSCANIIPPQGGPKDSLPPVIIKAIPLDSSKNFITNKITLAFNEFIEIQNVSENLLVSPTPKNNPTVTYKLNSLTVKLKDSLEPNTTYSLNFHDAIKDFSEGNILKGYTFIFSTGPYIDSLELHGKVILAETGKADSTLIVMLHTSDNDSSVAKEKPRYIARTDAKGNFVFKNLPPKTFYIYALKDEGGTHLYFGKDQLFAFANKPVQPSLNADSITLYAYAPVKDEKKSSTSSGTTPTGKKNAGLAKAERLTYQTSLVNNQLDLLGNFILSFDNPLRSFDSSKIHLYTDSTYIPVPSYTFEKDSTSKKVQLNTTWKENTAYHLILEKEFAEDSSGRKLLKTDTITFQTKKITDYGSLKLKFRNMDPAKNPVLQFVQNDAIIKSVPLSASGEFAQTLFPPGEYDLRILFDENKNGKWDPGEFFGKHKQPEIVKLIDRKITVKPGWQNEFEIAL